MAAFKRAERRQAKLKLGLTGPSGAGKTYSALLIATGMGKRIALVDTENASASLYADLFEFDSLEISPPYTIQKYNEAIKAAQAASYDVLIIDSISHAWAGDGGLLSKKEALDVRGGNQYTNWAPISKEHEQFKSAILNADIHLICTMRSKQDYVLEQNDRGKSVPRKVGLAPVQREGMEYEMTAVLDLGMDHNAQVSKDRTNLFDGQVFKPSAETGRQLMKWLTEGKPVEAAPPAPEPKPEPAVAQGPAPVDPLAVIAPKGIPCRKCQAELVPHPSGFICPNAKEREDGHARVSRSSLEKYRALVSA